MMKKQSLRATLLLGLALFTMTLHAADRKELARYYASVKGLKKEALKEALHQFAKDVKTFKYGPGRRHTWDAFYSTDRVGEDEVRNRYGNASYRFPNGHDNKAVRGMDIEHLVANSYWGHIRNNAYEDLHHLFPSDGPTNKAKSNRAMGTVQQVEKTAGQGFDRFGFSIINGEKVRMWEPTPQWKGDFARAYMYFAVMYSELEFNEDGLKVFDGKAYPTLRKWALDEYLAWTKADKINEIETQRNTVVHRLQGNRNPFIDFPFLAEYIWGDSINVAFDPAKTITTASDDDRYAKFKPEINLNPGKPTPPPSNNPDQPGTKPNAEGVIYQVNFQEEKGDMTIQKLAPMEGGAKQIWRYISASGVYSANASVNKEAHEGEATLSTKEIDLSGYEDITLEFEHSLYGGSYNNLLVEIESEGETESVDVPVWPNTSSRRYVSSGTIFLGRYAGKKIKVVFHYTADAEDCPDWRIRSIDIKGKKTTTGIHSVNVGTTTQPDYSKPYEAYTLDGCKVPHLSTNYKGIVIIKQAGRTWKVYRR